MRSSSGGVSARNADNTYRCAISIGGFSDLEMLKTHAAAFGDRATRQEQIGSDDAKIRRDSPLQNAQQVNIPVLLVHGAKDWKVQSLQTHEMAKALDRHNKDMQVVVIKGATHEMDRKSDRVKLLTEVEEFLSRILGTAS